MLRHDQLLFNSMRRTERDHQPTVSQSPCPCLGEPSDQTMSSIEVVVQWSLPTQYFGISPCASIARIGRTEPLASAMQSITAEYISVLSRKPIIFRILVALFAKATIGTAMILDRNEVRTLHFSAPYVLSYAAITVLTLMFPRSQATKICPWLPHHYQGEAQPFHFESSSILDRLWHKPLPLDGEPHAVEWCSNTIHSATAWRATTVGSINRIIIVIKVVLDEVMIALFLLAVSFILGIIVALCSGKADMGIAISTGIFTLVSSLHATVELLKAISK